MDIYNGYTVVDSLIGNKVFVTDYRFGQTQYVLEEKTINDTKPAALLGIWKLISKEKLTADEEKRFDPTSKNNLEKLAIYKDSIVIIQYPFKTSQRWKYYGNEQTIILDKNEKAIKVAKASKDSLVVEMDLSHFGLGNRKFVFTRE